MMTVGSRRTPLRGIAVVADAGGACRHIVLRGLRVHHVSGGWDRHGGHGICVRAHPDSVRLG